MNDKKSSEPTQSDTKAVEIGEEKQQTQSKELFPIVGIIASAGGLEAFTELLENLEIDTGMAFVLIQHLEPNHQSLLTEILAKTTQMPVHESHSGMAIEPNHVYVIPPNKKMTLTQGILQLVPREKVEGRYRPGDAFLNSLAAEQGNKAISVVLSGSDGDGTIGTQAIKAAGGITFAQSETSAQFREMPSIAIATGDVDFILSPQEIAKELGKIALHPKFTKLVLSPTVEPISESKDVSPTILALLKTATGVDFSLYKQATLNRRLDRRMVLYNLQPLEDYVKYLQTHPAEVQALYQEILINVTSFFRDPEAYQALKEKVFPSIVKDKGKGKSLQSPIRIWVTGCATGQEVYSIAICLMEFLEDFISKPTIQIFATDINETGIEKARSGIYKQNEMADVSPERLRRFFIEVEGGYQINKSIREQCIFARQNLISDPPFSNLDLITCRNLLIYLESGVQKQLMSLFHYSLKSTGFLMLGNSESVGELSDLFALLDRKNKVYSKKLVATKPNFNFSSGHYPVARVKPDPQMSEKTWDIDDLHKEADQIIFNRYAPSGVLISDDMDILQFRGDTSFYLRPAPGQPSFNLLKMARKGLLEELRTAVHQAKRQDIAVRKDNLQIEGSEPRRIVNVEVIPLKTPVAVETRYFLVLFEDVPSSAEKSILAPENQEQTDIVTEISRFKQALTATKQELALTQEYLESMILEQEATTQDLKVANEEILSSNEELQSTNEELQTAKEEVQATNEELKTTNEELQSRNLELHHVNNDLLNLLSSVNIPILILANDLRIRRFTPTAQHLLNLIPTDVGRPFSDIRSKINVPNLESLLLEVIDTLNVKELEVQDQQGHWYNLRIRPYRTTSNQIDGVVMVLMDIDAIKRIAQQVEQSRNYAVAIVQTVPQPLVVINSSLRVVTANQAFYQTFQISSAQTEQQLMFEIGNGQWNIPDLITLLEEIFLKNTRLHDFEVERVFEKIGYRIMLLNGCKIIQEDNEQMILLAIQDITQQKQFAAERAQLLAQERSARLQAEVSNRAKDEFLSILSHELRNPLNAILGWSQLLRTQNLKADQIAQGLEVIERCTRVQTQLIEDLLDISRITTGKLRLNNSLIDIISVIGSALEVVRLSAEAKNINISSHLQPGIGKVLGDIDRLQQILWNLLSNAVKFTPEGGSIEVTLERVDSHAEIRVSDTGIGIANDFLPYVFERFRQADSTKTRAYNGIGLGLSIVRYLIELHGGTVRAESPGEGLGTTIIVRLPLSAAIQENYLSDDTEQFPLAEGVNLSVDGLPSLKGLRILVVDDEADIRELLMTMLEGYGAEVTMAASAKDALSILTINPGIYDVLLSDIGMMNEDGYSLIRQVRSLSAEAGGQIPAAALTGYVRNEESQEAYLAGFQMHMAKPIQLDQLVIMVANLAGRGKN
ncbi:chemotaxis protein CheB [Anabaena cylindrica UHCC 0172]|uniref:chemotaxis protein CheB n=1 Tax=Anabaena cylindrica TaxID=1165 RepID=UPI002B213624|nr:chemotaxis protein CheB [Anabaena cylindrica]MEA5553190.1 chemotaxis protein CheB [Anabaena cylindrica UHCC 0172]